MSVKAYYAKCRAVIRNVQNIYIVPNFSTCTTLTEDKILA